MGLFIIRISFRVFYCRNHYRIPASPTLGIFETLTITVRNPKVWEPPHVWCCGRLVLLSKYTHVLYIYLCILPVCTVFDVLSCWKYIQCKGSTKILFGQLQQDNNHVSTVQYCKIIYTKLQHLFATNTYVWYANTLSFTWTIIRLSYVIHFPRY